MSSRTTCAIALAGPDALGFANAQFSSDLPSLGVGRWQWSAWLDPKGRVRTLLQIARLADDRLVAIPRGGNGEALAADLRRFVFRSKVKIDVSAPMHVTNGDAFETMHAQERDDGTLVLGEGDASLHIGIRDDGDAWIARHIDNGYAWLPDDALNALLPPALSMERLNAVAFNKGCFPGQEIAARLHYLGGHKRHLRIVESDTPIQEGQSLRIDGRDAGIVLMCNGFASKHRSLVVLDDTLSQADTIEKHEPRLHLISTFGA
ncbi:MAG: tRNA-modifying protein YgfZ [Luteibacter sp.]|uniref:CAF17-like 4Fe-4S cluster assembly/insertion protein YgfZ n=1 Tax=Luteibacter sp. TaxID=1886636 RepID=UPI0013833118|nr:folate-binding protein [Luteibacter sp.]KAF1008827.1 MAG: tRNA-modifying protein YgfZ [Luteibacter sp.]